MTTCCIFGLGYIGLSTALILSKNGVKVHGVDINKDLINNLNKGEIDIKEPLLKEIIINSIKHNNFFATLEPKNCNVYIIAVPTPFREDSSGNFKPDLSFVLEASKSIAKVIKEDDLVIIESTSPVGTTKKVAKLISDNSNIDFNKLKIAYCPERVLPGNIIKELVFNDRVVGGISKKSTSEAKEFIKIFCKGKIHETNPETAEMIKLVENSFRDVNIAFANELSMICSEFSINVSEVINIANKHPRVNILKPGCGVGGHCIAVDPWFLVDSSPALTRMIKTARLVNDQKSIWVVEKILKRVNEFESKFFKKPKIGILGITFKPDVDDLRESPALSIVNSLMSKGLDVLICEPNLKKHNKFKLITLDEVLKNSDLIISLVSHSQFKKIKISNDKSIDFCGLFE